jgi:hypothetical protein
VSYPKDKAVLLRLTSGPAGAPPRSGHRNPGELERQIMLNRDSLAAMAAALLIGLGTTPARALINDNLYTTYQFNSNDTAISWMTCGVTQQSSGCFGSGQLSGFGKVCAVLVGAASIAGNTVTQAVCVLDGSYQSGSHVVLDVFRKTDVITASSDATTFTLVKRAAVPLIGGASVSVLRPQMRVTFQGAVAEVVGI